MNNIKKRFLDFVKNEKTRKYWAIAFYFSYVISSAFIIPTKLKIIYNIFMVCAYILFLYYFSEYWERLLSLDREPDKLLSELKEEICKVFKELIVFIPIWFVFHIIRVIIINGISANQTSINVMTSEAQSSVLNFISFLLLVIIFGPIYEEFIFRFLPYKFIKNKFVYIIFSSVVFATMHVINDPKAYYYIWGYILNPIYYAYRYHKTKDIWVPASMHMFNNFMGMLPSIIAYF